VLPFMILGVALFVAMLLAANWYSTADTKMILKALKWGVIGIISVAAVYFIFTGRLAWAFMALPALLPWFFRVRAVMRAAKAFSRMTGVGANASSGQTSDVETPSLRMSLDHDSGEMSGEVLSGAYAGRRVEHLNEGELVELLRTCWTDDSEAARLLETFLDRKYPSWRGSEQANPDGQGSHPSGPQMGREEALRVLGLEDGASDDLIKEAHRRLIGGLHPDHGGSDYLAAKINEAKETLLGDR